MQVNDQLYSHLAKHKGFTAKAKDWIIVYTRVFETKEEAMREEKRLKSLKSETKITELIKRSSTE